MGRHDWFRSQTWDDEIERAFEARLARSRTSFHRAQYISIQGWTLTRSADAATREIGRSLLRRVIRDYEGEEWCVSTASNSLADSLTKEGDDRAAEPILRRQLDLATHVQQSSPQWMTRIKLAELLQRRGRRRDLAEAWSLLDEADPEVLPLPDVLLRICACRARLAVALGRGDAKDWALAALEVATRTEPLLPHHPGFGRPSLSDSDRAELERIARSNRSGLFRGWGRSRHSGRTR